jgi:hypothetical protein
VVEQQPSKLNMRVRFPLPAPNFPSDFSKYLDDVAVSDFSVSVYTPVKATPDNRKAVSGAFRRDAEADAR